MAIDHITGNGGDALCGNRNAIMGVSVTRFRADEGTGRYCARCVAKLAKMDAIIARREIARAAA
jgi:hypothetical protein